MSDLHVTIPWNRQALEAIPPHREDWLVVAGDVGEKLEDIEWALGWLAKRFRQVLWTPGNHELWTITSDAPTLRGEKKYQHLVELCRSLNIFTPEDAYPRFDSDREWLIAPLFLLYDYSFRPDGMSKKEALAKARQAETVCADEFILDPDPYPSREAWCRARLEKTAARLTALPKDLPLVLVSHFPLRQDLIHIPRIPDFSIWCGTRETEDWHLRYRVELVISGHLHTPGVWWRDGVRFEEVSFGWTPPPSSRPPRQNRELRQVLPEERG